MLKDNLVIFKGSLSNFRHTGCLWGSSRWLAKSLTKPLHGVRAPLNILEAGAGTGAITVEIIASMQPGDRLTICELNPEFVATLKERLVENEDFLKHQAHISFFTGYVQDLPEDTKYDLIVCSLPFLNFDIATVRSIFDKFLKLSTENGRMTYFEYLGIRPVSKVISSPERRERIKNIDNFFYKESLARQLNQETCWLNLFPTNVYTMNMAA